MPVSKNRKGHAKKALVRKVSEKNRKAHLENMYKSMVAELSTKYNTSVPELLNKEEVTSEPSYDSAGFSGAEIIDIPNDN